MISTAISQINIYITAKKSSIIRFQEAAYLFSQMLAISLLLHVTKQNPHFSDVASNNGRQSHVKRRNQRIISALLATAIPGKRVADADYYGAMLIALMAVTRSPVEAIAICRSVRRRSADNSFDLSMLDYLDFLNDLVLCSW